MVRHTRSSSDGGQDRPFRKWTMGWLVVLLSLVLAATAFMRAFRRRLDVLAGPWIAGELSRHE